MVLGWKTQRDLRMTLNERAIARIYDVRILSQKSEGWYRQLTLPEFWRRTMHVTMFNKCPSLDLVKE